MSPLPAAQAMVLTSFWVGLMLVHVQGHGRLWEPPSRSSMWRRGYNTPVNYQDNQLYCGGFSVQYDENGGKCGLCGDSYSGVREHETGGKYATGLIVRKYRTGDVIDVTIQLTAHHKGYFEFTLCARDDVHAQIDEECFAKNPLVEVTQGTVRYHIPPPDPTSQFMNLRLQLPTRVRCRACVLRWKYNAGNSWGILPDGTGCVGCGNQEQFYGCSDVAVGYDDVIIAMPISVTQAPKLQFLNETQSTTPSKATSYLLQGNVFSAYFFTILHLFINK